MGKGKHHMARQKAKQSGNASVVRVTTKSILQAAAFVRGHKEASQGLPFDSEAFANDGKAQWRYERGRQFAFIFREPIKSAHRVRIEAIVALGRAFRDGSLI